MLSGQSDVTPQAAAAAVPASLEERLAALESGSACGEDFDRTSGLWLVLLGVVIPVLMLLAGWWFG